MIGGAPPWLASFQARFGSVLRTPLDRASGTLTASTQAYDPHFVAEALSGHAAGGVERLVVYNRQYWFRLFGVLQSGFPLTSRLMGYWAFNELAERYLLAHPPRGWDIEQVADDFEQVFETSLAESAPETRSAWIESVRIDAAYRDVFRAPQLPSFQPSASDAPDLLEGHLVLSPALRLVAEHRPLVALRRALLDAPGEGEAAVELPPPLARPQVWAIARSDEGTAHIALDSREAELITLLGQRSIGDALACLERSCPPEESALLPERARAWLARSVRLGFWCGLRRKS
jgi:Putative DNA-binding domain